MTAVRQRRDFAALEARRRRAGRWFARGYRQADVVHRLGVSRQTASRWHQVWRRDGEAGLRGAGRAGRKPRLEPEARKRLEAALVKGPAAWGFVTHLWTGDSNSKCNASAALSTRFHNCTNERLRANIVGEKLASSRSFPVSVGRAPEPGPSLAEGARR